MLNYADFLAQSLLQQRHKEVYIRCTQRKKWVIATPEERVRQYSLYTLYALGYPASHIAVERTFKYLSRIKRFDILAYDVDMKPFLLIECKRSDARIYQADLMQLLHYNAHWQVPALALFNGYACYCLQREKNHPFQHRSTFPDYPNKTPSHRSRS